MWVFLRAAIYIILVLAITKANGTDGEEQQSESDVLKNVKKSNGYAVLTQSVTFQKIVEDYTKFGKKLSKREKILETEPGKLKPIINPNNLEFDRDFDRGKFLKHSQSAANSDQLKPWFARYTF